VYGEKNYFNYCRDIIDNIFNGIDNNINIKKPMTWQSMDFYPPSVTIKVLNGAILYDLGECLLVVGSVMGVM
jgi:hypothetical protein